jgi:hypothetical protein
MTVFLTVINWSSAQTTDTPNNNNANIRTFDRSEGSSDGISNLNRSLLTQYPRPGILDPSNPQCEYNWHRFEDKCFLFLGTQSSHTFEEGRYECSKFFRAELATIKSESEQKFVESILKGSVIYNNVWLGSKWLEETIDSKGGYYWVDGSPVVYHNKLLSPDLIRGNKSSMCLAMFMHTQFFGIWTPFNCNYYFHVLCERNLRLESNSAFMSSVDQVNYWSLVSFLLVHFLWRILS